MALHTLPRVLALSVCLALAGCAINYKSPGVSPGTDPSTVAIVEPEKFEIGPAFFISRIDGEGKGVGMISRIELAPGRHSITASVNPYSLRGADVTRHFTAKAGKKYLVVFHSDDKQRRWGFTIVEADTRTRVDEPY